MTSTSIHPAWKWKHCASCQSFSDNVLTTVKPLHFTAVRFHLLYVA